ncbi:related to DFG5 protein [Cephalotrichum gorgonifer]|uniref:Mannan endo-1,6-alpha-mannosidase n=1 Tax=Cephalotrichum gorgonifer TaxID=2041049 RepID=A0AAE8MST2_9PEZI|nr:related to DFG5 protein [Cephalotrichum gorgonifer]
MNLDDPDSIRDAASTVAFGLMKYYTGNNTGDVPGNLPDPYFWWEAGAMFGHLVEYWHITGDDTYNDVTMQAIVHQSGDDNDLMPRNQTSTEGNDDQGFWAMTAMSAAETNFPNPPPGQPQWLALVQAVFTLYVSRWDEGTCGGGLRWQIFQLNRGFNYKNSISNGCFFNIASRLARYTGNQTYADWAAKVYDWQVDVDFIQPDFAVEDGAGVESGCTDPTRILWSYNAGIFLHGAAVMYNITESEEWKARLDGLLGKTVETFFNGSVAFEQACEPFKICDIDQRSFKGYLLRWLSSTTNLAPHTAEVIRPLLRASAAAAAASCDGSPPPEEFRGVPGTACGQDWTRGTFDGFTGVGEQMNALAAVQYSLGAGRAPVTAEEGGTSEGDPDAGQKSLHKFELPPIGTRDRVAAAFLTVAICLGVTVGCVFVIL